jgi:hypothetical protein
MDGAVKLYIKCIDVKNYTRRVDLQRQNMVIKHAAILSMIK